MRESSNSKPKSNSTSRDAISPDVGKAGGLHFTHEELCEINDAISETVKRMTDKGQTEIEIKLHSLARLWSAWQKVTNELCGTPDTPGLRLIKPSVEDAIDYPNTYLPKHRR